MPQSSQGVVNLWLADLRETVNTHRKELDALDGDDRTMR